MHHDYQKLLDQTRAWYKTIKKVYCPALEADVLFNSKGFHHLLYEGNGVPRPIAEQMMRLELVRYAPIIIGGANDVTWRRKLNGQEYLVFLKMIDHGTQPILLRVIVVRKINGNHFYYSIMDD